MTLEFSKVSKLWKHVPIHATAWCFTLEIQSVGVAVNADVNVYQDSEQQVKPAIFVVTQTMMSMLTKR